MKKFTRIRLYRGNVIVETAGKLKFEDNLLKAKLENFKKRYTELIDLRESRGNKGCVITFDNGDLQGTNDELAIYQNNRVGMSYAIAHSIYLEGDKISDKANGYNGVLFTDYLSMLLLYNKTLRINREYCKGVIFDDNISDLIANVNKSHGYPE